MIRTLRAFFLGRLLREKLLLVAFALLGVLMWLSDTSKRLRAFWREQHTTTVALADQQRWLDNRKVLENAAQKAASRLDPAQTLDGTRLLAAVGTLAAEAGLRNTSSGTPTGQSPTPSTAPIGNPSKNSTSPCLRVRPTSASKNLR